MRPWQPFLRLPRSPQSPCFQRVCPTRAGTSYGKSLWRRNGGPPRMFCSVTRLSRAASEACRQPSLSPSLPARPLWSQHVPSSPARPAPRVPSSSRHLAPGLSNTPTLQALSSITSVCLVRTPASLTNQLNPDYSLRCEVDCCQDLQSPPRHRFVFPHEGAYKRALDSLTSSSMPPLTRVGKVAKVRGKWCLELSGSHFTCIYCRSTVSPD